jgi:ribonucleoside-diphosphate reductase alpha chain
MELAKIDGPYECFAGSPASHGILQFDLWREHNPKGMLLPSMEQYSEQEWQNLKGDIMQYGLRNSLLVAPMPTASTSQILGYNECFEPITSNLYTRKVNAGTFIITNHYMIEELISLGLWNDSIRNKIVADNGSIQSIAEISEEIKKRYLTVWEIPMRHLIDMSAERGQYICQSQSLNLFMKVPTYEKLNAMHFYSWNRGLKTGMYYLRSNSAGKANQITVEPVAIVSSSSGSTNGNANGNGNYEICKKDIGDNSAVCESCSA